MKGIRSVAETKSKVPSTKYVQGAIESENVHAESTKKVTKAAEDVFKTNIQRQQWLRKPQAVHANDKNHGTLARRHEFECLMNKIDLKCCCVVVCQLLKPIWRDFCELLLCEDFEHMHFTKYSQSWKQLLTD